MSEATDAGGEDRAWWTRLMDKRPKHSDRRWGWIMGVTVVLAIALVLLGAPYLTPDCEGEGCPSVERLQSYRPPEPPRIFDADGELVGQLSGPRRMVVDLDSIPDLVREGYIAVEDRRFREHGGIDVTGAFRALVRNLRSKEVEEGASTITMQLARNVFGSQVMDWNKWHRKFSEFRLAGKLEDQLTKDEILELYLNQIYLGDGVYGVGTAARHYFDTSISEVTPRQTALLVGLAKNPEGYNPRRNPARAEERIATILNIFESQGVLPPDRVREARQEELGLAEKPERTGWGANAYYLSGVRRELREIYPNPADREGLRVYTGLDTRAQAAALESLRDQIRDIEGGRWGAFRHETPGEDLSTRAEITSPYLQGMVVSMKPEDGLVTTLVGGRDYGHSEFDRAFQARRQPGSAFKPIVYAAAIGRGLKLSQTISTEPVQFAQRGSADWEPSDHVSGGEMTVREAVVQSSNTAAVRVGQRVGTEAVSSQARAMGIGDDLPQFPSMYLGSGEVVPAELVAAYATFVNGGHTVEPHLITRVEDPRGREVYRRRPSPGRQAIDPRVAFLVLDMMRDVTTRGTGWRVGESGLSYPAAGKTGTTNESRDVWFVGMTPKLVAGVWLGFDDPRTIVNGGGGGNLAAPLWARFMEVANRSLGPMSPWEPPPGVVQARVAIGAGYGGFAIPQDCDLPPDVTILTEYFLSGSEPAEHCPYTRSAYSDRYGWASDTVRWNERDSVQRRRDTTDRTIFWDGDEDPAERRSRMERERRLDSLERVRQRRIDRPRPGDTIRLPSRPEPSRPNPARPARPDTPRPDTTRPDTTPSPRPPRPDTTRPDTTRSPRPAPPPPDTTRPATPRPVRPDPTPPDTTRPGGTRPGIAGVGGG